MSARYSPIFDARVSASLKKAAFPAQDVSFFEASRAPLGPLFMCAQLAAECREKSSKQVFSRVLQTAA
jgi:hypothetical protein